MDKIWLTQYPKGVAAEIDPDAYKSVVSLLDQATEKFADLPAFANLGTTLTFSQLETLSRSFAAYLQTNLGITKGDSIALMLPNLLQYPISLIGAMRTGAKITNVNPYYTARELEHQLKDSGAVAIIIISDALSVLDEVLANTKIRSVIITQPEDMETLDNFKVQDNDGSSDFVEFKSALSIGQQLNFNPVEINGEDIVLLQYTGGTTGIAKGAILTHRNLVANVLQFSSVLGSKLVSGNEIIITALPLYHIFALTVNCLSFIYLGALNVLITNPRDLPGMVDILTKWRFSVMTGVNTLYNGLLHTPGFSDLNFSTLKYCLAGGSALHRVVAEHWLEVTECPLLEGYGLTETSPLIAVNLIDSREFTGSIGIPVPSTEISLRDWDGNVVPAGEAGELCIKGPQVMRGYWSLEDATQEATTVDGYFKTGDIATMDENGYFYIVDRKKDMILVSGFNVFPNEIEAVIAQCKGVLENACVGVTDEKTGEAVKAYVVVNPGTQLNYDAIWKHCKKHLTAYKIPKYLEFIDSLPKSSVGKILRRELSTSAETPYCGKFKR